MRYLILSDVHANLEAMRAVMAHAARKRRDGVLFLGDAVGYGAAPNQVVERLRMMGNLGVRFDYAYRDIGMLGNAHCYSIGMSF